MRRADGDGRARGRGRCARRRSSCRRGCRPTREASKAVFAIFERTSPLVEALSIDEAFLDVRGLEHISGTPTEIAARLRAEVRDEVGLPITVGLACTKFLAKVASGVAKPDGLLVIPRGQRARLPAPAAGRAAVGGRAGRRRPSCTRHGLTTVRQVARSGRADAGRRCSAGPPGASCTRSPQPRPAAGARAAAAALDRRAARARAARARAGRGPGAALMTLVDRVARRLRAAGRACRTVVLRLRFDDFSRATRSHTMAEATTRTATLLAVARGLLAAAQRADRRPRPDADRRRADQPVRRGRDPAGAAVRPRPPGSTGRSTSCASGSAPSAISRGALVGRDAGPWVPLLPD